MCREENVNCFTVNENVFILFYSPLQKYCQGIQLDTGFSKFLLDTHSAGRHRCPGDAVCVMLSGLLCTLESCLFLKLCLWNQPTQTSRSVAPQPPCAPGSSASGSPQGRAGPGTRRSGCPGPPASLWSLAAEWPLFTLLTEASDLADKNTACPVNFEFQTNMNNV